MRLSTRDIDRLIIQSNMSNCSQTFNPYPSLVHAFTKKRYTRIVHDNAVHFLLNLLWPTDYHEAKLLAKIQAWKTSLLRFIFIPNKVLIEFKSP